jgi:hypothetical protein
LEDAVSIWLLVHYDIAPTTAETPAVQRLRARAQQEVSPLLTLAPGEPVQRPATRIVTRYLGGGEESRWPQLYLVDNPKTWVPADALAGLCRQCGHVPPWEQQPPLATLHPALVPQETLALGADEGELATGGRPSTNAGAYAYIDSLLAKGSGKAAAYQNAASKFPSPGIDHDTRANQLASGYRQRNRNHRNKAHKPL